MTGRMNFTDEQLAECDTANFDLEEFNIDKTELAPLNISDATTGGAEFEWYWQLTSADRFQGFLTFIFHNKIGNVDGSQLPSILTDSLACHDREGGCPSIESLDGNKLPYAPTISASVNYAHDFDLGDYGAFSVQGFANISSSYYLTMWNVECYTSAHTGEQVCDNGDLQDAYFTLDANLTYNAPFADWYVELFGNNLTDTRIANSSRRNGADEVVNYAFNARRHMGVRAGYKW
jgi:hypothetical protein